MKQIYNFEQRTPPVLNENILRNKMEQRRQNWQMALVVTAGILMQMVVALLGYSVKNWCPWLTVMCFGYILVTVTGSAIIAVVFTRKGDYTVC